MGRHVDIFTRLVFTLFKALVLNLWGIPHWWGMAQLPGGEFRAFVSTQPKVEPNIEALVKAKQMQKSH